ncbi:MAG: 2-isopropylmalate synthase [Hydrogenothermaceae bacterium]|nr:2-isopropylmalate synthase [Hydrogenothermaceae bacterium]
MEKVYIFDTTLRDGEQAPGFSMTVGEKVKMALQLEKLGVDVIEAGFAAASEGDFEAVKRVAQEVRTAKVCSLARALESDIDKAGEALSYTENRRIHTFIATSPIHMQHKLKMKPEDVLERAVYAVKHALRYTDDVEFSAEDAFRSEREFLYRIFEAVIEAGVKTINVPDTVGYAIPEEFGKLIADIKNNVPNIDKAIISVHCHNDLGLAVANSLAAVKNGARQVHSTINGIGERAGNAAVEEVVMAIKVRQDYFNGIYTTINTREIYKTSRLLCRITGSFVQPNKAIVGDNAFAHEAGIHQHGILAHRETYEIMRAEDVGVPASKIILGKHSGRHAFKARISELGYTNLSESDVDNLFTKFKKLADKKKEVFDEDIEALILEELSGFDQEVKLEYFHVLNGNGLISTATVKIVKNGEDVVSTASGDGPIDAVINAVEKALEIKGKLMDYTIRSLSSGKDAMGEVRVIVRFEDTENVASGKAVSTDIIEASLKAYIDAFNRYMAKKAFMGRKISEGV